MANQLKMATVQFILELHAQGWSGRRIARELGVDRETVSRYVAQSKPANAPMDRPGESALSNLAKSPIRMAGRISSCAAWREVIQSKHQQQLTARRIYQDLISEHGASVSYD